VVVRGDEGSSVKADQDKPPLSETFSTVAGVPSLNSWVDYMLVIIWKARCELLFGLGRPLFCCRE